MDLDVSGTIIYRSLAEEMMACCYFLITDNIRSYEEDVFFIRAGGLRSCGLTGATCPLGGCVGNLPMIVMISTPSVCILPKLGICDQ